MKTTFSVFILLLALNVNGSTPEEVARNYFEAFSRHDFVTMGHLYDDSREGKVYHDDIFLDLSVKETQSMWRMLLEKSDLELTYRILSIKGNEVTAHWEGNYTYPDTGRSVHNVATSHLTIKDGFIERQRDDFDLCRWTGMALPKIQAKLTCIFPSILHKSARKKLESFMKANP